MATVNMKHSKGVCDNDSMSIFGDCPSNELLELFKSKKLARVFMHMLKSLVHRNHNIHNSLCESYSLLPLLFQNLWPPLVHVFVIITL